MSNGHNATISVPLGARDSDYRPDKHLGVEAPPEATQISPAEDPGALSLEHVWQMFGYTIFDGSGTKVGPIARIWTDMATGRLKFVGLTTGRIFHQTRVIPAQDARIDDRDRSIMVPYQAAAICAAPHHNSDIGLKSDQERKVQTYYDNA